MFFGGLPLWMFFFVGEGGWGGCVQTQCNTCKVQPVWLRFSPLLLFSRKRSALPYLPFRGRLGCLPPVVRHCYIISVTDLSRVRVKLNTAAQSCKPIFLGLNEVTSGATSPQIEESVAVTANVAHLE